MIDEVYIAGARRFAAESKSRKAASMYQLAEFLRSDAVRLQKLWKQEVVTVFGPNASYAAQRSLIDNGTFAKLIGVLSTARRHPETAVEPAFDKITYSQPEHEPTDNREIFERLCAAVKAEARRARTPRHATLHTEARRSGAPNRTAVHG